MSDSRESGTPETISHDEAGARIGGGAMGTVYRRDAFAGGILFAVAFGGAGFLLGDLWGSFGDSDDTFSEYYGSTSNRAGSVAGAVLLFVSGLAMLPFIGGLGRRIEAADGGRWVEVLMPLSYVASGVIIGAAAASGTVGASMIMADVFDEANEPFQGGSAAVLPQLGYVLIVFSAWTLAVVLVISGVLLLRAKAGPAFVGWLAIVCAAALLLAPAVLPLAVLPLWVLIASVFLFRSDAGPRAGD